MKSYINFSLFKLAFASIIVFGLDEDVCEWVCAGYMSGGNAQAYFLEVSPLPTTARTNEYFQLEHLNFKPPTSNIYSTCKQDTIKRHSISIKSFMHPSQSFPQTIGIIDQDQGSGRGDLGSGMLGTEVVCFKAERCGADQDISGFSDFRRKIHFLSEWVELPLLMASL